MPPRTKSLLPRAVPAAMDADFRILKRHLPAGLALAAFLLYLFTGSRSIQWQDSGQFTYRIGTGTLWNEYGLAMTHPLHFMLGRVAVWLFPGNVPWAVAGVSALGGGLAVGGVFACARQLTSKTVPALFAALSLMLAHTFWRFSGLPEVYSLSAALLILEVCAFLRLRESGDPRWWWILFGLAGLGFANHNLALLALPVWGVSFLLDCRRDPGRWRHLPLIGLYWTAGALPYLAVIVSEMLETDTVLPALRSALFGHGFQEQVTGLFFNPVHTAVSLGFLALSFPNLCLPLAAAAVHDAVRKPERLPPQIPAILAIHLLFFLRYNVIDQYTFLIPGFALMALLGGRGYARIESKLLKRTAWALLALQPVLYGFTPDLLRATGVLADFERHKPYRDDYDYLFRPWSFDETSAAQLAENALDAAGPRGLIVFEDSMAGYALAWERHRREWAEGVDLLRPAHMEPLLEAIASGRNAVWIPAKEKTDPPDGWRMEGKVWMAEPGTDGAE